MSEYPPESGVYGNEAVLRTPVTRDEDEFNVIFIHATLDEARLTANQFRVYAHFARRANRRRIAWPGVDSISENCLMSKHTVIDAIRDLEEFKMIEVTRVPGIRNQYRLTPPTEWKLNQCNRGNGSTSAIEVTPPVQSKERHQCNPDNVSISNEVNPSKCIQPLLVPNASASPTLRVGKRKRESGKYEIPTGSDHEALCDAADRRYYTPWSPAENRALSELRKAGLLTDENLTLVKNYYEASKTAGGHHRRDLLTLLNNFTGEVDRARLWEKSPKTYFRNGSSSHHTKNTDYESRTYDDKW